MTKGMLNIGDTVIITEDLEQAFLNNGRESYVPTIHDVLKGKSSEVVDIEAIYSNDYCSIRIEGIDKIFSLPVCGLRYIWIPNDENARWIAECSIALGASADVETVKQWFAEKHKRI